jgi:glycosyltransferase involved in cell wall biosynthesis
MPPSSPNSIRVLRIITRMNIGGPSRQAGLLTQYTSDNITTRLLYGKVASGEKEDTMQLNPLGEKAKFIKGLGRSIHFGEDLITFFRILFEILKYKPHVVHTHMAKAGALGRIAAWIAGVPVIMHTYHGHVFTGYFSARKSKIIILIEQCLAMISTRLITISKSQQSDILDIYHIGKLPQQIILPLGLQLDSLQTLTKHQAMQFRLRHKLNASAQLIIWAGRLTEIKQPILAIETIQALQKINGLPEWQLVIAGDGELYSAVSQRIEELGLSDKIKMISWETDIPGLWSAASVALLTSKQEGTPVSLIEAMAAGVPWVSTAVGGIPDITPNCLRKSLCSANENQLADAVAYWLVTPPPVEELKKYAWDHFDIVRLRKEIKELYTHCLAEKGIQ